MKLRYQQLADEWLEVWPEALSIWSPYTQLHPPLFCQSATEARSAGLTGSFAMIRLVDQSIVVSLPQVRESKVEDCALQVLAHEIGHHILAPATLTDHGRMLARMRRALPTLEMHAPMLANLYTDLLINDRLQRSEGLDMARVYQRIVKPESQGQVWRLYLRIYELLWRLDSGTLVEPLEDAMEGDARLGADLLRSYARNWMSASGRFASLFLPYLVDDTQSAATLEKFLDTRCAAQGGQPTGLVEIEADEVSGAVHPAVSEDSEPAGPEELESNLVSAGQCREPFEYGELLRAAGLPLDDHEVAVRYYRERAQPYLVPFPSLPQSVGCDPLPEGFESWEMGDPLEEVDWMQTLMQSPQIVPGLTTVRRVWGVEAGIPQKPVPLDLDVYVDSSGSMINPQRLLSFPALAGAILCLSALRAGASVQVTLWSGKQQFLSTKGFIRNETEILRVLTGYFGGATAFPIHVLRDTFAQRPPTARPAHILIVSDDGVTTMFDQDERGNSGWTVSAQALASARGGGTMVLNLNEWSAKHVQADLDRARRDQDWNIHAISNWEELIAFARNFSQKEYGNLKHKSPKT